MRTFSEIKIFMRDNLVRDQLEFNLHDAHFQVYKNARDMNMSVCNSQCAVIKFEERQPDLFTVAVANDECCIINYGREKVFKTTDSILSLIDAFPDGYLIDFVVSALLRI